MKKKENSDYAHLVQILPLWQLNIKEVIGRNLEFRGRREVNKLLKKGWILLHIYTLKYEQDGVWRERPMAILGRLSKRLAIRKNK